MSTGDAHAKTTLEDFAFKGMHLAKMTGVSVACHAIPDGFLLQHVGVGCKYKAAAQISTHDWGSHPNRREAWTQVAELQLIKGSSERIGPFARSWYERRRPNFMCVVSAYFIELTGEDYTDAVTATAKTLPCDMAFIKTVAPNKGFFEGYAEVMYEVAAQPGKDAWKAKPTRAGTAAVFGNFFHRYEPDQFSDVAQLKGLLKVAGLEVGPVLFSGQPYAELVEAHACSHIVTFPYVKPKARKFKRLFKKREVVECDLPMGIAGTTRFVRQVAMAHGADMEPIETWLATQAANMKAQLDKVSDRMHYLELVVFAETPWAAGLVTMLTEMGINVPVVGLRDTGKCLGGKAAFFDTLDQNDVSGIQDMTVLEEPSLRSIKSICLDRMSHGRVDGIIGSSHELELFIQAPRTASLTSALFLLETGYPSDHQHAATQRPTLGFAGTLAWAQAILDHVHQPRFGTQWAGR